MLRDRIWALRRTQGDREADTSTAGQRYYGSQGHELADRLLEEVNGIHGTAAEGTGTGDWGDQTRGSVGAGSYAGGAGGGRASPRGHAREMARNETWARDVMASMLDNL